MSSLEYQRSGGHCGTFICPRDSIRFDSSFDSVRMGAYIHVYRKVGQRKVEAEVAVVCMAPLAIWFPIRFLT